MLSALSSTGTSHLLNVSTQNPNNSTDINPSNDKESIIFSSINGEQVQLNIMTDNYALETSWVLLDQNNNIIDSGDSLINNTLYQSNYCLAYSCYRFVITDSHGDGFCCNFGNGNFAVNSSIGNNQYAQSTPFTFTDTSYFCIGNTEINEHNETYKVYPNPTSGTLWVNDNLNTTAHLINTLSITNIIGKEILFFKDFSANTIDLSSYKNGVYFIKINTDKGTHIEKIILTK